MNELVTLNKDQLQVIKDICRLIPKTAADMDFTQIFFYTVNNSIIIYAGSAGNIQYIYEPNITANIPSISMHAHSLLAAIKDVKGSISLNITSNQISWNYNRVSTNLNVISTDVKATPCANNNYISIDSDDLIRCIKEVSIKGTTDRTTSYLQINSEGIRFVIIDGSRMTVSSLISATFNLSNMFLSYNYNALLSMIQLVKSPNVELCITASQLIIKDEHLEISIGLKKAPYISYDKFLNYEHLACLDINIAEFNECLKSLIGVNKNNTAIVEIKPANEGIMLECLNPNIGKRQANCLLVQGKLNRILKLNLIWLFDCMNLIKEDTCKLMYSDSLVHPIVIQSSAIYIIAPIVTQ